MALNRASKTDVKGAASRERKLETSQIVRVAPHDDRREFSFGEKSMTVTELWRVTI